LPFFSKKHLSLLSSSGLKLTAKFPPSILCSCLSLQEKTMASSSSARSSRVATCLVLLLLVVSLREASAARPLRPAGDVSSEVKDQAIVDKYAPLLLAMLPRAPAPPSAPSGGTNEAGN
uniref:Uncharacterized protein n=3 Tax=Triticinae TaxID=1648030 RepID=A0A453DB87_AEGTS